MKLIIAAALMLLSTSAQPEFWSGNQLKQHLDTDAAITARGNRGTLDNAYDAGASLGFIIGVHDALYSVTICSPQGATAGQLVDIVRLYLRAVPHRLHENADRLVREALERVFPCPQQRQSPSSSL